MLFHKFGFVLASYVLFAFVNASAASDIIIDLVERRLQLENIQPLSIERVGPANTLEFIGNISQVFSPGLIMGGMAGDGIVIRIYQVNIRLSEELEYHCTAAIGEQALMGATILPNGFRSVELYCDSPTKMVWEQRFIAVKDAP